jgi:hypothetical protein
MNLTAYSDSESDGEAPPAPQPAPRHAPKPSFHKVVDRSNPGRITVNLPGASLSRTDKDHVDADAPPAKKPRLGGATAFGGFNAMLPAPKKPAPTATAASATPGKRALGKGLAAGVNLRTGAEPAFKREPRVDLGDVDEHGNPVKKEPMNKDDFRALLNLPTPRSEQKQIVSVPADAAHVELSSAPDRPAAAARFVPMSVGKGMTKKKKPVVPSSAVVASAKPNATFSASSSSSQPAAASAPAPRKPKVSLFGVSQENSAPASAASNEAYTPMLYGAEDDEQAPVPDDAFEPQPAYHSQHTSAGPDVAVSHDLTGIASELNLSEAERRQLFGKRGKDADFSSARIVEFNTDTEYAHNEKLRQQGEQVQHNALKSISGTGKNSLRSLINVASTQKEALEEHFAAGYRNKREAGNKYGW